MFPSSGVFSIVDECTASRLVLFASSSTLYYFFVISCHYRRDRSLCIDTKVSANTSMDQ